MSSRSIETVSTVTVKNGEVYVTTFESRPGVQNTGIKFIQPHPAVVVVPEQGDQVEVYDLEDGSKMAGFAHNPDRGYINGDYSLPSLQEGDILVKPDGGSEFKIGKNSNGNYDIDVKASGSVNVEADTVNLGGTNGKTLVTEVNTNSDGTVSSVEKTTKTKGE